MPDPQVTSLRASKDGRSIDVAFPDVGDMRDQVAKVLSGEAYPSVRVEGHEPRTVVDIGANVGASAVYFHMQFPAATVYCYEPSPANFAFLQHNLGTRPGFVLRPYGLGDREERVRLYAGRAHGMQNSVVPGVETSEDYETVDLRKASSEFDAAGLEDIDVLKVDTEGCELPILRDLGIERLRRVGTLCFEYHADEDRRAIDALLGDDFLLCFARGAAPHRGTLVYVNRRVADQHARFDELRLRR